MKTKILIAALLSAACAGTTGWRADDAAVAQKIEMQVDTSGSYREVEYHVDPSLVPARVRDAMDALHPGGRVTGAEKERSGGALFWELTKVIDGREVEAMFRPDGTLHSEEIEVGAGSVPTPVKQAVARRMDGTVRKWEEIRDGARMLVEYHAKISADGRNYKLRVSGDGEVLGVLREVEAEIEVPV